MKTLHSQENRCGHESWGRRGVRVGGVLHHHVTWDIVSYSFNSGREETANVNSQALHLWASSHFSWEGLYQILLTHKHPIFWCKRTVHKLKGLYLAPFLQCLEDQRQVSSHFTVPGQIQLFKFRQHFKCFSCLKKKRSKDQVGCQVHKGGNSFQSQYNHHLQSIEARPGPG